MLGVRKRPQTGTTDWYHDASPEDRQEYDAFGPWIQAVPSEAQMPPRFRPWWPGYQGANLLFKVPQNIDRRDARPGWDLYRAVLAIHQDRVCFLNWDGSEVTETRVPIGQIVGIGLSQCLLAGEFQLLLADGRTIRFFYNTVSRPVLVEIVDQLRRQIASGLTRVEGPGASLTIKDYHFHNLAEEQRRRDPRSRVIFFEEPGRPCADERGRRRLTPGLMVLDTGDEKIFLTQGSGLRKKGQAPYDQRCLHLPSRQITATRVLSASAPRAPQVLALTIGNHSVEFPFLGALPLGLISS